MQTQEATTMAADDDARSIAEQIDEDPELVGVTAAEDRQRTRDLGDDARKEVEEAVESFYNDTSIYAPEAETEYDAAHCDCGWAASNQGADVSRQALERLGETHAANCEDAGRVVLLDVCEGEHTETKTLGGGQP